MGTRTVADAEMKEGFASGTVEAVAESSWLVGNQACMSLHKRSNINYKRFSIRKK